MISMSGNVPLSIYHTGVSGVSVSLVYDLQVSLNRHRCCNQRMYFGVVVRIVVVGVELVAIVEFVVTGVGDISPGFVMFDGVVKFPMVVTLSSELLLFNGERVVEVVPGLSVA